MKNKKNLSDVGILGYGEVGKAMAKFYKNPKIKDLGRDDGLKGVEILNVCIPWSDNFVETAIKEIKNIKPKLTIIHSTVAPETTKKIISKLPKSLQMVVHSPVRGVHPHLYEGIKTFVKFVGAEDKKSGELAKKHLENLGIKTELAHPAKTSELAKLFCTTYYGLCVAWHGEMERICKKEGVNFRQAVSRYSITYNDGYSKLGMKNVIRPVLYEPNGKIGGHCVISNTEIFKKYYKSEAFDLILKYKPKKIGK